MILANPNNPDGRMLDRTTLSEIVARRGEGWLLVDEAFADVLPERSMADQVRDDRRLILFRSFGKFFGLAGLRLGFVIAPRDLLARLRQTLGAWPLSAAAIAIGTAAYRDADWIASTRTRLFDEAAKLDALLARAGLKAVGQCPLFRLIEDDDAALLFDRLARDAILTRPFAHDPRWLRIGLPADDEAAARLEVALRRG